MSVYNVGQITMTSGSTTVSGYSTEWYGRVSVGDIFMKRGDSISYTVAGIVNNLQLSLKETYPGPTVSGQSYDIFRDFTVNASLIKPVGADRSDWPAILASNFDKIDNWALGWNETSFTCTYASSSTFICSEDKTALFYAGMRLKIVHGGGTTYHDVVSSVYSSVTTVTISATITTPISRVYHGTISLGVFGSYPTVLPANQDSDSAAPTTGTWPRNWLRWNSATISGENIGWVCTVAGTPGSWHAWGIVSLD